MIRFQWNRASFGFEWCVWIGRLTRVGGFYLRCDACRAWTLGCAWSCWFCGRCKACSNLLRNTL